MRLSASVHRAVSQSAAALMMPRLLDSDCDPGSGISSGDKLAVRTRQIISRILTNPDCKCGSWERRFLGLEWWDFYWRKKNVEDTILLKRSKQTSELENILTRPDLVPFCSQCGLMGSWESGSNYWIHFSVSNCSIKDVSEFLFQEILQIWEQSLVRQTDHTNIKYFNVPE